MVGQSSATDPGGWMAYLRVGERKAVAAARAVVAGTATFGELADALTRNRLQDCDGELPRHLAVWLYLADAVAGRPSPAGAP